MHCVLLFSFDLAVYRKKRERDGRREIDELSSA